MCLRPLLKWWRVNFLVSRRTNFLGYCACFPTPIRRSIWVAIIQSVLRLMNFPQFLCNIWWKQNGGVCMEIFYADTVTYSSDKWRSHVLMDNLIWFKSTLIHCIVTKWNMESCETCRGVSLLLSSCKYFQYVHNTNHYHSHQHIVILVQYINTTSKFHDSQYTFCTTCSELNNPLSWAVVVLEAIEVQNMWLQRMWKCMENGMVMMVVTVTYMT